MARVSHDETYTYHMYLFSAGLVAMETGAHNLCEAQPSDPAPKLPRSTSLGTHGRANPISGSRPWRSVDSQDHPQ